MTKTKQFRFTEQTLVRVHAYVCAAAAAQSDSTRVAILDNLSEGPDMFVQFLKLGLYGITAENSERGFQVLVTVPLADGGHFALAHIPAKNLHLRQSETAFLSRHVARADSLTPIDAHVFDAVRVPLGET